MAEAPDEPAFLAVLQKLSRHFPEDLAKAAIEQAILRKKAQAKFSSAERMFFAPEPLEQATPETVAAYRAARFAGLRPIFDLGCGLGGDTLALARVAPVVAVDRDPLRLCLLAANASAIGLAGRVSLLRADLQFPAWHWPPGAGAFFDPARRSAGRRIRRVDQYQPPLELVNEWLPRLRGLAAKISPAVELAQLSSYDCEIEFVSLRMELKEAILWFGELRTARRRATVLPGPHSLSGDREPDLPAGRPLAFLYEPNAAVMRAGLVRNLGVQLEARLLDPTIAYLTADRLVPTPFARTYTVVDSLPFQLKRLRERLRQMNAGPLTIKKRGSAIEPQTLVRKLGLRGEVPVTVVLTRVLGKPYSLIVEPTVGQSEESPAG